MSKLTPYTPKAEKYARYRWRYSDEAVQTIFQVAHLTPQSRAADLGAGTGILTHCFAGKIECIFAVEPDPAMRKIAERVLAQFSSVQVLDGTAEATGLPQGSVDLVTAAQAIHWFEPQAARREICRILKPDGWLAVISNSSPGGKVEQAIGRIFTAEHGVAALHTSHPPKAPPLSFYFGRDVFHRQDFPFTLQETWEEFFGSLCSASYAPDENHHLFPIFEQAARQVFEQFCSSTGLLTIQGETHLAIGQVSSLPEP